MQIQTSAVMDFARIMLVRGIAPFGMRRAAQMYRDGVPEQFRPALDFLFARQLQPQDTRVVERVEAVRAALAARNETLDIVSRQRKTIVRTTQYIAKHSSVTRDWGTFLYLCAKGFRAETILELGSCAGISGSYLAAAPTCREFITIERSPALTPLAQTHIQKFFPAARVVNATIDDVLSDVLGRFAAPLDFYYVDANHEYAPTLRYFENALPYLKRGTLVVFDDIHWSQEMWHAWQVLRAYCGFSHTIDIGRFGLCVWQGGAVRPQQHNLAKYAGWLWKYTPR